MAPCFVICLNLSVVELNCVFYSETQNSILCGILGRQSNNPFKLSFMNQMCYAVKNALIFKIADSFGLLRGGLVYSGFICSSWAVFWLQWACLILDSLQTSCSVQQLIYCLCCSLFPCKMEKNGVREILCIECVRIPPGAVHSRYLSADSHLIRQHP